MIRNKYKMISKTIFSTPFIAPLGERLSVANTKMSIGIAVADCIIPTTSKKASSAQGYATSVALATGWRATIIGNVYTKKGTTTQ